MIDFNGNFNGNFDFDGNGNFNGKLIVFGGLTFVNFHYTIPIAHAGVNPFYPWCSKGFTEILYSDTGEGYVGFPTCECYDFL